MVRPDPRRTNKRAVYPRGSARPSASRPALRFRQSADLIGVTNQVLRRWEKHKSTSSWADQIATITIEHYATRAEAEAAETEAILSRGRVSMATCC